MLLWKYLKHIVLLSLFGAWEYWLRTIELSTAKIIGMAISRIINKGRNEMPKEEIQLGSVGKLELSFSGGKAVLSLSVGYSPAGASLSLSVVEDAEALIDLLFKAVEDASPAGAVPIEETVKALLKSAVASVK